MEERALIVQEDLIMNKILERLLSSRGYHCRALLSVEDIEPEDIGSFYEFVITDLLFQGINTVDYILHLKEVIRFRKMIIVTGLGQERIKRNILKLTGVQTYFEYPVDLERIEKLI